jgi:hypothetical protein
MRRPKATAVHVPERELELRWAEGETVDDEDELDRRESEPAGAGGGVEVRKKSAGRSKRTVNNQRQPQAIDQVKVQQSETAQNNRSSLSSSASTPDIRRIRMPNRPVPALTRPPSAASGTAPDDHDRLEHEDITRTASQGRSVPRRCSLPLGSFFTPPTGLATKSQSRTFWPGSGVAETAESESKDHELPGPCPGHGRPESQTCGQRTVRETVVHILQRPTTTNGVMAVQRPSSGGTLRSRAEGRPAATRSGPSFGWRRGRCTHVS